MTIRILLADDHTVLREGLKALLNSEPDIHVIGDASDGREAIAAAAELKPDMIMTDISMPGMNGIELAGILRQTYPYLKIIILSMHANQEYISQAFQAGVNGYVVKHSEATEVINAIRAVINGETYLSPSISKEFAQDILAHPNRTPTEPKLTTREREVAHLIAEGHTTRKISRILTISVKTVETHRANIMKKLNAKSPADIVKYALKKGWITLDD